MNSQTHLLLASAILGRGSKEPARMAPVLVGATLPDLSIFVLFGVAQLQGISSAELWGEVYWQEPWQTLSAISNSFPLFLLLFLAGLLLSRTAPLAGNALRLVALAALLHLAADFPLHADDAHRHFWPLTDWRFFSPVSYWDPRHFGLIVSALEAVLGLALVTLHWRWYTNFPTRALLVLAGLSYVAVPAYFILSLG